MVGRVHVIAAVLGAILLMTGCSAGGATEPTAQPSVSPGQGSEWSRQAAEDLAACLTERGWEVRVASEGGWGVESGVPVEQRDVFDADRTACIEQLGLDAIEMTPELAAMNFENTVRVVECLGDAGYQTTDGPSQDEYVARLLEDPQSEPWAPYELVPADQLQQAIVSCPQ